MAKSPMRRGLIAIACHLLPPGRINEGTPGHCRAHRIATRQPRRDYRDAEADTEKAGHVRPVENAS